MRIAILLTCFNREHKTYVCLSSLSKAISGHGQFDVYLVDDGSTDGTARMIAEHFPEVRLIKGSGSLFWAGGMRLAWQSAINSGIIYDGYLLINDDVELCDGFMSLLMETHEYALSHYSKPGLYVLSTKSKSGEYTYGGHVLRKSILHHRYDMIIPANAPQSCDLTNANIMFVSAAVYERLGILDTHFTHSLADFDYGLSANEAGFPVLVGPSFGGYCEDDHQGKPLTFYSLKVRISSLYSVKGIALNEHLYYLNKRFRFKSIYAFIILWLKTLFPRSIK